MRTKISAFCEALIEGGWLLALVIVPLFFNVYSSRVFEPDKLSLLRSIATLMAAAWLVKTVEGWLGGRSAPARAPQGKWLDRLLATPLVALALLTVVVYLLATLFSVVPRISLWGSYQRLQGTYTTLSYIVIFFLMLQSLRRREQLRRLVTTVILTSFPIAVYGIVQHYRLDPLPWAGDVSQRVAANMGNSIFVAAYLIMAVPLTLARIIQLQIATLAEAKPALKVGFGIGFWALMLLQMWAWIFLGFGRGIAAGALILAMLGLAAVYFGLDAPRTLVQACCGFTLNAQIVCIAFTQSRGPWLGFAGFLYFFVLIMLVTLARRAQVGALSLWGGLARGVGLGAGTLLIGGALGYVAVARLGSTLLGLGLAASIVIFPYVILLVMRKGLPWLWLTWITQTVLVAGFLVYFNLPGTPVGNLRDMPYIGRLGRVFETESGTGKVRVLIWEGAVEMLKANPLRTLIGYGPEAMYMAYNPFYPPDLAHYEARNASPDRSHNETFDALIMTGVAGCIVYMLLFGSIFYYGLTWFGLIHSQTQRLLFLILGVAGSLLGGFVVPYALDGGLRFMGVGLPTGFMAGVFLYVIISSIMRMTERAPSDQEGAAPLSMANLLLLVALVGAVAGHFIEINFGIAIASTRTYFWIYAATIVALGQRLVGLDAAEPAPVAQQAPAALPSDERRAPARRKGGKRRDSRAASHAPQAARGATPPASVVARGEPFHARLMALAVIVALILMTMVWDYTTNPTGDSNPWTILANSFTSMTSKGQAAQVNLALVWLMLATAVVGLIASVTEAAEDERREREASWWLRALGIAALIACGAGFVYALVHATRLNPAAGVANPAFSVANIIYEYYTVALLTWLALAGVLYGALPRPATAVRGLAGVGYAALAVVCVLFITGANASIVKADVYYKQGLRYDSDRSWDGAIRLYQEALKVSPQEDYYHLFNGRALMEKAKLERDPKLRDQYFAAAVNALETARRLNPLNTDHTANLGRLHRTWAELDQSADGRQAKLRKALDYYEQATRLSPNNAGLYNEWAIVYYLLGDVQSALAKYDRSLELDSIFPQTYLLLGDLYMGQKDWPAAARMYERLTEIDPGSIQGWSALAYSYSQMGELEKALAANVKVLEIAPNDYSTLKNMALLLNGLQRPAEALPFAERALAQATAQDKPTWESFVQQLRAAATKG